MGKKERRRNKYLPGAWVGDSPWNKIGGYPGQYDDEEDMKREKSLKYLRKKRRKEKYKNKNIDKNLYSKEKTPNWS
jgi:hypothetical protein